jgi:hypothetical protein
VGKWRYSSTILDFGTRWKCVVISQIVNFNAERGPIKLAPENEASK